MKKIDGGAWLSVLVVAALGGCKAYHRASLETRAVSAALAETNIPLTLGQVEARIDEMVPPSSPGCDFCQISRVLRPTGHEYCFRLGASAGCVEVRPQGSGSRVIPSVWRPPSEALARLVWQTLDPEAASGPPVRSLEQLAELEVSRFTPRFSPLVAARGGVIVSMAPTDTVNNVLAFAVGGVIGARYWAAHNIILGVGFDAESLYRGPEPLFVGGVHLRGELSLWEPENERFLNIPSMSLIMAVTPVLASTGPVVPGVKATLGIQIAHFQGKIMPFFIEGGFQWIQTTPAVAGPRVGLGLAL